MHDPGKMQRRKSGVIAQSKLSCRVPGLQTGLEGAADLAGLLLTMSHLDEQTAALLRHRGTAYVASLIRAGGGGGGGGGGAAQSAAVSEVTHHRYSTVNNL